MDINFKANLISKTNVFKRTIDSTRYFPSEDVAFIGLELNKPEDIKLLSKLKKKWYCSFAQPIYRDVMNVSDTTQLKIYALTTQVDNFEKLDYQKVLGITELREEQDGKYHLEYLQVNPIHKNDDEFTKPIYKNIGTKILQSLKELNYIKSIKLLPLTSTVEFYARNGFVMKGFDFYMFWQKK